MVIVVATIWISILLFLIFRIFTFPTKDSPKYFKKKRTLLLAALLIHIVCSLAFLASFMSAVFNAYPSI